MKGEARKAAVAAYKERKVVGGVYAVRCTASGEIWVGQWPDIATIQTRLWFELRRGTHLTKDLRDAWNSHGEAQFSFEVLERLEDDMSPYMRASTLKTLASQWREKLQAHSI
ncbi:GIY-YIG nuclease family protein [Asticcacaulis sp. 201]|uniref:GIY-YIG nuclease family protein n=1 Tax=Asticcacaulis sp. 201 TaxID=3028787 RepID=UPI002916C425|nr:GIY-YIG nuclease family protein [Asticcacaulis sp. 201]MDV6330098.1 GIY-YIG nuclease family protein [Asticcacaulis sp. 201]